MNIISFSKLKDGQYKLTFLDNTSIIVHEDLILKYELLLKKNIDNDLKEKILTENLNYVAYTLAIKYISVKMRSVLEIKEYLTKKGVNESIVSESISLLKNRGYLNDNNYAKSFVNDKIRLSLDGPYKIARELSSKGVEDSIIDEVILLFDYDIQMEKCHKIALKMVGVNHKRSSFMLKKKINEHLNNLGYDSSIINSVLNKIKFDEDDSIFKKEYDKIYKRLSKKYQGKELEYKIKQKMYALGFNNIE